MSEHGYQHGTRGPGLDNERRVFQALILTGLFTIAEGAGGIWTGSLALLADAGHMLTDTASLGLAWLGFRIARRPSDARRSYGYHRFQVLAAFVNGLALFALAAWIVVEAVERLAEPVEILAGPMLTIALAGLVINVAALRVLHGADEANLNVRGATLHVMGDLLGSLAALAAGAIVFRTGWTPIDPLLSLVVAAIVTISGLRIVRQSGHILLEGAPAEFDQADVKAAVIGAVPKVTDVHHVHAWLLTDQRPLLTLHAVVPDGADRAGLLAAIKDVLAERFSLDHTTVQVEVGRCPDD